MQHHITPMHVAAKWGKANMVAVLLDHNANLESKTRDGLTPLHCAARSGHENVVDLLLERGAPISSKTKVFAPPIYCTKIRLDQKGYKFNKVLEKSKEMGRLSGFEPKSMISMESLKASPFCKTRWHALDARFNADLVPFGKRDHLGWALTLSL